MFCLNKCSRCGMDCVSALSKAGFVPLSTRLFPKFKGAEAYHLTGIAGRCDWVVLSDRVEPFAADRLRTEVSEVRTVFVSLRSHEAALAHFFAHVLPRLTRPFVLITGSEDITLPYQTDKRWPAMPEALLAQVMGLADHPLLQAWFCENLDTAFHEKVEPLPLGLVSPDADRDPLCQPPRWNRLDRRAKRVLCAHRVRDGDQWEPRRRVTELANAHWRSFTTILTESVSEDEFAELLQTHAFVLCVEGGGLDPSPKAWQSLLNGAVPIMRDTPTTAGYEAWPCIRVPDWRADTLHSDKLEDWFNQFFANGFMRRNRSQVLERLGLDYWWAKIEARCA